MASSPFPTRSTPPITDLKSFYIGRDISSIPLPAAVLDRAIISRHCTNMLETVKSLRVGFRAHVKTTKTTEVTALQVGMESEEVNLVASTVLEIESLVPFLLECKQHGRQVNVLYGLPLPQSQVGRLVEVGKQLGRGSISVMIDHPAQLAGLQKFYDATGFPAQIFLKVNTGGNRAGLPPSQMNKDRMLDRIAELEKEGIVELWGIYSHNSHSYAGESPDEAMLHLVDELNGSIEAVKNNIQTFQRRENQLVIAVGASPQVVATQNLNRQDVSSNAANQLRQLLSNPGDSLKIELHAGVYPILDMQQMYTHARLAERSPKDDVALTIVAEVCSVYRERQQAEALIAAGCLAFGREPSHPKHKGFAVVSDWRRDSSGSKSKLILDRISQEHGILTLDPSDADVKNLPLEIGQIIRLWPNHACIAGAQYGWYVVVDSTNEDPDKIVDVWPRWSGW